MIVSLGVWMLLFVQTLVAGAPQALVAAQVDYLFVNVFPDGGAVYVVWNEVDNADSYTVQWRPVAGGAWNNSGPLTDRTTYTVVGLPNGEEYEFQVLAMSGATELASSQVVVQRARSRTSEKVVSVSWPWLTSYLNMLPDPPDYNSLRCRGQLVAWSMQALDCVYQDGDRQIYLLRAAGANFDPPQDVRPIPAIRALAKRGVWRDVDPFADPAAIPLTVTQVVTPVTGLVTGFDSAHSYAIQVHPQLVSRITWFIPKVAVPGRYAIYHEGHCLCPGSMFDPDGAKTISWLLARGWQVVGMDMPLYGQNAVDQTGSVANHNDMMRFDDGVRSPLQYFFLPVKAVVDLFVADAAPADPLILLSGRSGGGWTSYFYSPLDPRVDLAVSVAGGLPLSLRTNYGWRDLGDGEQLVPHLGVLTNEDLMLASGSQAALLIYNEFDACCHTFDPDDPNYAAFVTYLESAGAAQNKPIEVFVDRQNPEHSIGQAGYAKLTEFLTFDTPPLGIKLATPASLVREVAYTFTATVAPLGATPPITFTWRPTDHPPFTTTAPFSSSVQLTWSAPGLKQIEVVAANRFGQVTATYTVAVAAPPTTATIAGPPVTRLSLPTAFTATVAPLTTTLPLSYVWMIDRAAVLTSTGGLTDSVLLTLPTAGAHAIHVNVSNGYGVVTATTSISVLVPISQVTVSGPATTIPQVDQLYTAKLLPLVVSPPVTYVWSITDFAVITQTGGSSNDLVVGWSTPGQKQIQVRASNALGSATTIYTVSVGTPVTGVILTAALTATAGVTQAYTATVAADEADGPITYVWSLEGQPVVIRTGQLTDAIQVIWPTVGVYRLQVTAKNRFGEATAIQMVTVGELLATATVTGPTHANVGQEQTYAVHLPAASVDGITYKWQVADGVVAPETTDTQSIRLVWNQPGSTNVQVTVSYAGKSVTLTYPVVVAYYQYLPLISAPVE